MRVAASCSFVLCLSIAAGAIRAGEHAFDVVVYGATPGGITAAVAAARQRASVVLIEPSRLIGDMVSGGLSATDYGNPAYNRPIIRASTRNIQTGMRPPAAAFGRTTSTGCKGFFTFWATIGACRGSSAIR
jgi:threonine dehydrogenase-like Zn-dependent dehydrogenase